MSDNGQWLKLWCSALNDPNLDSLGIEDFGRWVKLAMLVKQQGNDGTLLISKPARTLQSMFQVDSFAAVLDAINRFPNCVLGNNGDGVTCNVSFSNWKKYQVSTSTERVRKFRQNETHKRRGDKEEKKTKKRSTPPPTPASDSFDEAWAKEPWPSVRRFVALYNTEAPDEWPSVERVSEDTRAKKIREYLTRFPTPEFWTTVFRQAKASRFLRSYKNGGLDWLLQRGQKDGVENCVKVYEGKYGD